MAIDKDIFTRLKRLFSTDSIIRNVGGNQLKVVDVNKIQSLGLIQTNSLIDRFTKLYSTTGTGIYNLNNVLNYQTLRIQLYTDYEAMDTDAIIASTLDIIADECTLKDEGGEMLHIRSSDENVQKILYNLFYDVLNIEFNMWSWVRQMCKYGDFYIKLEIAEEFGIYNVVPYSAYNIIREEGSDPQNPSYVRFRYDPNGLAGGSAGNAQVLVNPNLPIGTTINFENYEMAHFRLIADANYLPYGRSYIEPARKTWKAYTLMEDAMLIHRIMRAPERRIFYVNVGNIPANEVEGYMQKIIQNQKKTPYIDPQTGQYNLKFNMMNMMEDYYVPRRGNDNTTTIDTLKGLEYNGIEDVEYLRDKLFAALKVPKAFMGYEKDLCISPETLIPLLDGRILSIKDIIEEFNNGKVNFVRSVDIQNNTYSIGKIEWAGFTRLNTETIKIYFDENKFIQCTPDHLFLDLNQNWIEAGNLKIGDPLYPGLILMDSGIKEEINWTLKFETVSRIELIEEKIDTCDLKIEKYHNFSTQTGVIIHNSGKATLAAEDIRFARTIERLQRIIISELTKIALVHLYAQGYEGESLTNFELSLTTPSIIYDQERIALLKEKVDLATSMMESNLMPTDWIYHNIFHFSEDQFDEIRDLMVEDKKRLFRLGQIENEGNDPAESGKSYGTPHDLATLYGKSKTGPESTNVPTSNHDRLGRPETKVSNINTQNNPFGKDRIGRKEMGSDGMGNGGEDLNNKAAYKGNGPLSLESINAKAIFLRNKQLFNSKTKKLIFEKKQKDLLDESNLLDESAIDSKNNVVD